jgi:hypothetical protein
MRSPKQVLEITIGKGVGAAMAVSAFGLITGIYAASPGTSAARKLVRHEAASATVHDRAAVDVSEAASARFVGVTRAQIFFFDGFDLFVHHVHRGKVSIERGPITTCVDPDGFAIDLLDQHNLQAEQII